MKARRVKVPLKAKLAAMEALERNKQLPKSKKAGLTRAEASKLGITSGLDTARLLIRSNTISVEKAKQINRFYKRFRNQKTPKTELALKLWGGRMFGKSLSGKLERFK